MILKTIEENGTMLDLVKLTKKNLEFYLKYRNELADIHYTNEQLLKYIDELDTVIKLYNENKVGVWFKNYHAYLFTSARFPYILPFLPFCFSFKEFIDVLLLIGKTYHDDNGKKYILSNIEYMNASSIVPIFIDEKTSKVIRCESYKKDKWNNIKEKIY